MRNGDGSRLLEVFVMTGVKKGDKVLSLETGKLFEVKVITNSMSVLESEDKENQLLLDTNYLGIYYEKVEEGWYNRP
jgi:hypothetical protein